MQIELQRAVIPIPFDFFDKTPSKQCETSQWDSVKLLRLQLRGTIMRDRKAIDFSHPLN